MGCAEAFQDVQGEVSSLQGQDSRAAQAALRKAQTAAAEATGFALAGLARLNGELVRSSTYFVAQADNVEAQQERGRGAVAQALKHALDPEVMDILKGNADQLFQLKQKVVAEQQVAKENRKKMLLWLSGPAEQQGASTTQPGQLPAAADAVKQRGFRPLQLPGSSIAAAAAQPAASTGPSWQQALKFWQVGTQNSKQPGLSRAAADQQPSKSLSSLLFGNNKSKRQSSAGADASGSRLLSIDPAASWRSSADGSVNGRRSGSNRSSEAGGAAAAAVSGGSAGAERGAVLSSLAAGEGPLSKSHSLLATKPVAQQEQILGQALEIVAEDEREGRDSPAPPGPQASRVGGAGQALGLAPIRVPRASVGNRPVDSFSFGNKAEDEAQSPSFLRASVSSRSTQLQGPAAAAAAAGPLVRSSTALRASMAVRVDPFEAPEPQPQPFVEALQEGHSGGGSQGGIMAALRRSISGGGRATHRWGPEAAGSRRPALQQADEAAAAAAAAVVAASVHQQQLLQQQTSEGGADMQFLDLDATRAYALGVHQVMMRLEQGMQSLHSHAEAGSRPQSPRTSSHADAAAAAAAGTDAAHEGGAADHAAAADAHAAVAADGTQQEEQEQEAKFEQQQQLQKRPQQLQRPGPEASPQDNKTAPGTAAATPRSEAMTDAMGTMPPLRSGMSSPAVRQYAHTSAASTPRAQLPLMGQGPIDILERQLQLTQQQQMGASRQASLLATSTSVSLAEVYKATSGNLAPLSSNLTGRRQSSSASKAPSQSGLPPRGASSSRGGILGGPGPSSQSSTPFAGSGGRGPLSMQYGSTMQQAKKSAQAAGLPGAVGMQEQRSMPAGWTLQQGGASGGPLGLDGAGAMDPMAAFAAAAASNNKYASSWGLAEGGGLSRQSSLNGGQMSRLPSGGPLARQGSGSARASPRISTTDEQAAAAWQQQVRGAAGRYAGSALTPNSQSPRSGTVTPGREDSNAAAVGIIGRQQGGGRVSKAAAAAAAGMLSSSRQAGATGVRGAAGVTHAREAEGPDSEGYESAEEQLSSSALSGGSGPYLSAGGAAGGSRGGAQQAAAAGSAGNSGSLPQPPGFLSGRPTSAQAAVATQWSPSKHASAFAQAPAYMREPVLRITPEVSSTSLGLAPSPAGPSQAAYRDTPGVSPRDGSSAAAAGGAGAAAGQLQRPGRVSSRGSIGGGGGSTNKFSQAQPGYEGGYNIYAPLGPPVPRSSSGSRQQQQAVVTAVDLARRQSQARRASSTGPGSDLGGYLTSSSRRTSNSNVSPHTLSSFQGGGGGGGGGGSPSYPYAGRQQQPQQPAWGSGSTASLSIYAPMRPPTQRQQYRF